LSQVWAITPATGKFCKGCGHNLREPKEAPSVDYSEPQSYTPKHLADKILTTRSSIEGERKLVTVFFADVANYTSVSEKLDPEEIYQIMGSTFRILMDEIHRYEGTINQFTGDNEMALFGVPVAHEDHTQRACYFNVLEMIEQMDKYWKKLFADPLIVNTPEGPVTIAPQRTNNILERFFRGEKRRGRKRSGTASLNKTLKTILADTPLVRNLEKEEYQKIILNGCTSLAERFSQIDDKIARDQLKQAEKNREKNTTGSQKDYQTKRLTAENLCALLQSQQI